MPNLRPLAEGPLAAVQVIEKSCRRTPASQSIGDAHEHIPSDSCSATAVSEKHHRERLEFYSKRTVHLLFFAFHKNGLASPLLPIQPARKVIFFARPSFLRFLEPLSQTFRSGAGGVMGKGYVCWKRRNGKRLTIDRSGAHRPSD